MYARTSIVQFQPGMAEEAIHIFRDIMLPDASTQQGFRGALMVKSETQPGKHVIISLWETKADLLASRPPEHMLPDIERLGTLIADISQDICEVLLQMGTPEKDA